MNFKRFLLTFFLCLFNISLMADEVKLDNNTELNVFTGMFDFSDDGKKSSLIGFQHQNENLNRDTFLGNLLEDNLASTMISIFFFILLCYKYIKLFKMFTY